MQKQFTVNVPDELWVDSWELNNTATYTYNGPEKWYVEVITNSAIGKFSSEEFTSSLNNAVVVELDSDTQTEVAQYFIEIGPSYEYTYEDVENHDGTIYKKITNPRISDYFELGYNPTTQKVVLVPHYLDIKNPNWTTVQERIQYIKKYADNYEFDTEDQTLINNTLQAMQEYEEIISKAYPWKYISYNKAEVPKIPVKLVTLFNSLPTV